MRFTPSTRKALFLPKFALVALALVCGFTTATRAQSGVTTIPGVHNFGKVTDGYFRGGEVTPAGVDQLQKIGVRTIIDLRDEVSHGEAEACERNGIKYFKFPLNGHETPDAKTIDHILSLIHEAKEPVYVHCSGGKHRAGTVAALYRTRFQGWSKEQAWKEQQSYGFGLPEEHPKLYAFVYDRGASRRSEDRLPDVAAIGVPATDEARDEADGDGAGSTGRERDDDSDKAKDRDKESKKERKAAKERKKKEDKDLKASKKKDDSDDEDDEDDEDDDSDKSSRTEVIAEVKIASATATRAAVRTEEKEASVEIKREESKSATEPIVAKTEAPAASGAITSLTASGDYMNLADAIIRARTEGGTGDVLKIDLEWDPARSIATWDVTFASGDEYELNASSGKLLGKKSKVGPKLAVLVPLAIEGSSTMKMLSFQEIIEKAETARSGQRVLEMELKHIKGRAETVFEVAMTDGMTLYFEAATGKPVATL